MGAREAIVKAILGGKPGGPHPGGIHVYHSSPHDFDKFDWSKLRTGEGANVYGSGFYFAENPAVSGRGGEYWQNFLHRMPPEEQSAARVMRRYGFDPDAALADVRQGIGEVTDHLKYGKVTDPLMRQADREFNETALRQMQAQHDLIARGGPVGPRTYEVNIAARPELMLDWDKPLKQQSEVLEKIREGFPYYPFKPEETGQSVYTGFVGFPYAGGKSRDEAKQIISERLGEAGIPGIRYLDQGSRNILHVEPHEFLDGSKGYRVNGPRGDQMFDTLDEAKTFIAQHGHQSAPSYNYVVTDPSKLDIMAKYGVVGTAGGGLGVLAAQDSYGASP